MNKQYLITVVVAIVVGAIGFFAGMKYQERMRSGQFAGFQRNGARFQNGGARPLRGQIIAADDKSITVKMPDGSSKIVLFSDNTNISQATKVSISDLKTGETVLVLGNNNADGSVTATNISINPEFGGGPTPTP